jgi:GntR family transcriptional regulator
MKLGPDDQIVYDAPVPPYKQLAGILAARIDRGDWKPGRAIPSESQLSQTYGLARATVRRALTVLATEGRVYTVQSLGTYVSEQSD